MGINEIERRHTGVCDNCIEITDDRNPGVSMGFLTTTKPNFGRERILSWTRISSLDEVDVFRL